MKIIAVMNQKGGIGKTMTAASIAYILGEEGKNRVLIVDADQQGNISQLYNCYDPEAPGMSELLEDNKAIGGNYYTSELINRTPYEHVNIIPANGYLMNTNAKLLAPDTKDQITRFSLAINEVRPDYDICIVDCGLLMDLTVTNVLAATDLVIVPVKMGGFEIEAATNTELQLSTLQSYNKDIRTKVLFTMKQQNKATREVEQWIRQQSGLDCFEATVRRSVVAEKSTIARKPLPAFSPKCLVAQDYREVVRELVKEV